MNINLKGKRALVCGSTQGIGLAIAKGLAQTGCSITLLSRNEEKLSLVKQSLYTDKDQIHNYIVGDFSDPVSLEKSVKDEVNKNGGFEILINNTGGPPAGPILSASTQEFKDAFSNHLLCNHLLVRASVDYMKEKKFGRIINIISTSVKQPLKGLGVSNTVRAAVANWSKTLSFELASFGITVNNVLPGATATQRLEEIIKNKSAKTSQSIESVTEEMVKEIPAARFAQAEEIANAVIFLSSTYASYITGINLPVDGGRTLCL